MRKFITFTIISIFLFANGFSNNQDLYQTIRGKVIDKDTKITLIGATVIIVGTNPWEIAFKIIFFFQKCLFSGN